MLSDEFLTKNYDYKLPPNQIASSPVYPRDSAKLLVYNRKNNTTVHTTFSNLLKFIPKECSIILNDTKVIKARIFGQKEKIITKENYYEGGGKIELLFNKPLDSYNFLVLIRGKVSLNTNLIFDDNLIALVTKLNKDGSREVTFSQNGKKLRFEELVIILDKIGHIPLPPYIQREDTKEDEKDYQTLFASNIGAVASPTASLHFTPKLFKELQEQYQTNKVTLHVGSGTFKPVDEDNIINHPMHSEYFNIPHNTQKIINNSKPILAIGTTVTRTIEYYERTKEIKGECNLFLHPNNPPKRVNHLLTNFHLPKSTLIMLVSAFIGREKTLELYKEAIKNNYRFFSYGDAMLII